MAKYLNDGDAIGPSGNMFESDGNVGIGTSNTISVGASVARDRLNVRFTNTTGTITGISVRNDGNTATSFSGMLFYDQNGTLAQFQGFNNVTHEYRINNIARNTGNTAFDGSINFMTGGVSRLFVSPGGNISIGTSAPTAPLEMSRSAVSGAVFTAYSPLPIGGAFVDGRAARGSATSPSAVLAGDLLVSFGGGGYDSTAFARAATIDVRAAGDWSSSSQPADLRFFTTQLGSTNRSERMRITDGGNVGIGRITPADRLQVFGDIRVGTSGSNGCLRRFNADALAGVCASDRRFKRDITSFGAALTAVAALRPVHYYRRADEFPEQRFGAGQSYGLIAQEVERVLPELVVTNPDGYKAVDYSKLPLLTVQAIKELKAENDALQSKVTELERLLKQLLAERSRF